MIKCLSFPNPNPKFQHVFQRPPKCCELKNVLQLFILSLLSLQNHIWIYQGAWECVIIIDHNITIFFKNKMFWLGTLWQQYFWILKCLSKSYLFWKKSKFINMFPNIKRKISKNLNHINIYIYTRKSHESSKWQSLIIIYWRHFLKNSSTINFCGTWSSIN